MAAKNISVDLIVIVEVTEEEFLGEFTSVMREWGFRPFRCPGSMPPGEELRFPTLKEALGSISRSPYQHN